MGRIILLILIVATIFLLWQAFAPQHLRFGSARRPRQQDQRNIAPKGPDDDPDFLWNIKKERFKEQRRLDEQKRLDEQRRREERPKNDPQENPGNPDNRDNPED